MAAGPGRVRRQHAAERRARGVRRIERQPLAARAERSLQCGDRDARLRGRREVARLVLDERVQTREHEDQSRARRGRADANGAAAAPGHDRHAGFHGVRDDGGDLVDTTRQHRGLGRAAFDHVA